MGAKTCTKCGETKVLDEFYANRGDCKACNRLKSIRWRKDNPGPSLSNIQWKKDNPEKFRSYKAKWRDSARVERAEYDAAYVKAHLPQHNAKSARRRASELQATPKWANEFFIEEAYALAKLRTEMTGFKWNVDHIVPLKSKKVCGLHVEFNLQVIPEKANKCKGNRHWPDMPQQGASHVRPSAP